MARRALVGAALALVVTIGWGCGQSTPVRPSSTTSSNAGGGGPAIAPTFIYVLGGGGTNAFSSGDTAVSPGSPVVFMNSDEEAHHIVANDASFDTGVIEPSQQSAPIAAPSADTTYHCAIHPGEVGTIKMAPTTQR